MPHIFRPIRAHARGREELAVNEKWGDWTLALNPRKAGFQQIPVKTSTNVDER